MLTKIVNTNFDDIPFPREQAAFHVVVSRVQPKGNLSNYRHLSSSHPNLFLELQPTKKSILNPSSSSILLKLLLLLLLYLIPTSF